ncbi:hypothetical protein EDD18DRAFT_1284786 [Armillaria luteobubalina]|uniref:Fork-head domain-containing protein n=1 Tax=Armillaria luteobubalina TaxID=153913 RepID=A0AA39Q6L9_9AGAR|nr:hypothetical protein EDD18DRAFT_1284786 [Armillaria luteobubalina]
MNMILARHGLSTTLQQIDSQRVHLGQKNTENELEVPQDEANVFARMNSPPSKSGPCLRSRPSQHSSPQPTGRPCTVQKISYSVTAPLSKDPSGDSNTPALTPSSSAPLNPHPYERPDITYVAIIKQAVLSSPDRRLSLSEIYDWITTVYPFFSPATKSWKNSIRHTLSSYPCFRNKAHGIWAMDDVELENNGIGSLQKRDALRGDGVKTKQAGTITALRKEDPSVPKLETRKREIYDEADAEFRQLKKGKKARSSAVPDFVHGESSSCPPFWRSSRILRDYGRTTASDYGSDTTGYRRPMLVPVKSWATLPLTRI